MLPLDLLREMIGLVDDSETYRSFALASAITSKICLEQVEVAKRRFTVKHIIYLNALVDDTHINFSLPNGCLHGPMWNCALHVSQFASNLGLTTYAELQHKHRWLL